MSSVAADDRADMIATVSGITNKDPSWLPTNDVCTQWSGVSCSQVGVAASRVTGISWARRGFQGTINWGALPPMLRSFDVRLCQLSGPVVLTRLPSTLAHMDLSFNNFSGEINLSTLPSTPLMLLLESNQISGSVNLTNITNGIVQLDLSQNLFTGSVDLRRLPASLGTLLLGGNNLTGTVDLTALNEGMKFLQLFRNKFSGTVDLTNLPPSLTKLWLSQNRFTGPVDVSRIAATMEVMDLSSNMFCGTSLIRGACSSFALGGMCAGGVDAVVACPGALQCPNACVGTPAPPRKSASLDVLVVVIPIVLGCVLIGAVAFFILPTTYRFSNAAQGGGGVQGHEMNPTYYSPPQALYGGSFGQRAVGLAVAIKR